MTTFEEGGSGLTKDRGPQRGIRVAELHEAARPVGPVQLDQLVECGLDRRPAVRIHRATQNSGSPFNSNASQARAERRSRFAVASEIPTAVALSSSDRPPK